MLRFTLGWFCGICALVLTLAVGVEVAPADTPQAAKGDWPWWRGPDKDGVSLDAKAPTKWSPTVNVLWKAKVPGRGHCSPAVCGERIFLTNADDSTQKLSVLALERKTGKPLWTTALHEGGFTRKHPKNTHASASPACDGKRVYSVFSVKGGLNVSATDLDGKILWQTKAGDFAAEHGYGSSPALHSNLVIVNGDSLKNCFIAALDAASGKVVWKTARTTTGAHGSYATPIVVKLADRWQVIMPGMRETCSYDPETGKLLWSCRGPAEVAGCTPAFHDPFVFSSGGFPEREILAIRADGSGDVTKSHVVWRAGKGAPYVPSPLYYQGHIYLVSDNGVATCLDAKSGKQQWQERLEGAFSSSPVLAGGLIYATNEAGKTYLLQAGPKFVRAGANDLGEPVLSTPAICGGQIFLRTDRHLYCIGSVK